MIFLIIIIAALISITGTYAWFSSQRDVEIVGFKINVEIAENLEKQYKIKVDKKKINLKETIKTLGTQTVEIKLFEGVIAKLKVQVVEE